MSGTQTFHRVDLCSEPSGVQVPSCSAIRHFFVTD